MSRIRQAGPQDAPDLAAIYRRSVQAIGPRDYAADQVAAWSARGPDADRFRARLSDGRRCWVALDQAGEVEAFVDLEADGHIDFLYAAPEAAGTGAASRLLDELETTARAAGLKRLHVEASEAARRFFLKRGYVVIARRDFEIGGVAIHNYAMERRL